MIQFAIKKIVYILFNLVLTFIINYFAYFELLVYFNSFEWDLNSKI